MTYHLIGIKGTGMSALAQILCELGYEVQGSDIEKHFFTEEGLNKLGIKVLPYNKENINKEMYIIRGNSVKDDNEEVIRAKELDLTVYTYQEMVSKLTKMFTTITVAGCHGKTTTSAMMSLVLDGIVGANYLIGDGTGHASKENKFFVLESCEYYRHFLEYSPYYAIITNIDLDHTDYFKDLADVMDAFTEYANNAEKMVIACGDDAYVRALEINKPIFFYGIDEDNDIVAKDVEYTKTGTSFDVFAEDNYYGHFDLPIFGKHMLQDALAVISICYYERLDAKEVGNILKTFTGAKRRFAEIVVGNTIIVDDYAHHPNEMKATLKAVKQKYPNKEIIAVFQPHTFSRLNSFKDDYISVLETCDEAYIFDVHPAREVYNPETDVTSDYIISKNKKFHKFESAKDLEKYENAVIVFMSPNDLGKHIEEYKSLKEN